MPAQFDQYPLLVELAKAGIVGRGGAAFPTHLKWLRLKELGTPVGYVVCNASEGELNVHKDAYILDHFPEKVIAGMIIAMDFLDTTEAYFNINQTYFDTYGPRLKAITDKIEQDHGWKFHYFIETPPSYIGGETGALLNAIEGKRCQPRLSPPSPSITGIHGKPVLVNNVETYYDVARVVEGSFEPTRHITIVGPIPHPGVYTLNSDMTVLEALNHTGNLPSNPYFLQVGGSASGEVITSLQAETQKITGCGTVEVFGADATPYDVLYRWFEFYEHESCGKCTPCREGTHQLLNLLKSMKFGDPIPWEKIKPIIHTMKCTSFCDLGKSLPTPVETYMKNILNMEVK